MFDCSPLLLDVRIFSIIRKLFVVVVFFSHKNHLLKYFDRLIADNFPSDNYEQPGMFQIAFIAASGIRARSFPLFHSDTLLGEVLSVQKRKVCSDGWMPASHIWTGLKSPAQQRRLRIEERRSEVCLITLPDRTQSQRLHVYYIRGNASKSFIIDVKMWCPVVQIASGTVRVRGPRRAMHKHLTEELHISTAGTGRLRTRVTINHGRDHCSWR